MLCGAGHVVTEFDETPTTLTIQGQSGNKEMVWG